MMTRTESLQELLRLVEAGEGVPLTLIKSAFPEPIDAGYGAAQLVTWCLDKEDLRAMGAAKALHEAVMHEAVLVTIRWSKRYEEQSRVRLWRWEAEFLARSSTPARSWLIAIIKALIAQEEQT